MYVLGLGLLLYIWIWSRAEWPAGGQDSWNHLLYARWSVKHPELMLDQWGKPFFTIPAIPFSFFGIQGLYVFNMICILGAGWIIYLTARKLGMRLPWMATVFFIFQPIVFGNVISGLTEPINALAVAYICYLYAGKRNTAATILASFLPFFRSEGFVLLAAVFVYLVARRYWKQLPLLLTGSVVFILIAGFITGSWTWIVDQNPYLKFESKGEFNPGHGDFFYYTHKYQHITGLVISALLLIAFIYLASHVVYLLKRRTPEEKSRFSFWLLAPLFLSFFLAHSYIWWKGSMGSHGLTRVFLVVAPCAALLALYALDKLLSYDLRYVNKSLPVLLVILCIKLSFNGAVYPYPWQSGPAIPGYGADENLDKAFAFIKENHLENKPVIHQMPFINAQQGWDPWADPKQTKTFYIWSLNRDPKKDWLPDSSILIWDGWHALRDAPMPLDTLRHLPHYKEIAEFPAKDSIYSVHIFLKTPNLKLSN